MSKVETAVPLVETPTEEFDQLAMVNEVLAKRQEEASELRVQISNLRHAIQTERIRWDEQRQQEVQALKMRQLQLEQQVAEKLGQADQLIAARLEAFQQAENERRAAVTERVGLQQDRAALGNLNHERVEVERFRLEVNRKHAETMQAWNEAQAALNTANQQHEQATKALAEVERRTADLSTLKSQLEAQTAEQDLRAKHLNAVQEAIGQVIEKLPVPTPPSLPPIAAASDLPPVSVEQPLPLAVQELPTGEPMGDALPALPPLPGLDTTAVEIAKPTETNGVSLPDGLLPSLPDQPTRPYVHPAQRRVMDGTKPLNEQ